MILSFNQLNNYCGDDSMAHNRGCPKGLVFTAFGAGILLALCFPVKIMLFILAVMLVILGITSCQR
jgi:hypothetical protein